MRKLASIRKISRIDPIPGKDRIALATVDGWSVIVNKADFAEGSLCVFVEIDSVLPERPEFEFLRSKNFRIKTMKMAGVISQGICFPLSILPGRDVMIGDDVTEILGIRQYEPTMDVEHENERSGRTVRRSRLAKYLMRFKWFRDLANITKHRGDTAFTKLVRKTDETRIQEIPYILLDKKTRWVATEKIDGQSGTFVLKKKKRRIPFIGDRFEFEVYSRNKRIPVEDDSSYWAVARKYDLKNRMAAMIDSVRGDNSKGGNDFVALQGEVIGPKIQKNKYGRDSYELYIFNLIYPFGRIDSETASVICEYENIPFVPILNCEYTLPYTVQEVLDYAHGKSELADINREGIVFRDEEGKQSFKAVDPLFLMQYDE